MSTDDRINLSDYEVSRRYGIPLGTLRYWRLKANVGMPYRKVGRRVFYDIRECEQWLAALPGGGERERP